MTACSASLFGARCVCLRRRPRGSLLSPSLPPFARSGEKAKSHRLSDCVCECTYASVCYKRLELLLELSRMKTYSNARMQSLTTDNHTKKKNTALYHEFRKRKRRKDNRFAFLRLYPMRICLSQKACQM